ERRADIEDLGDVLAESWVELPQRRAINGAVGLCKIGGDGLVGLAERDAPRDEVLGEVRGEQARIGGCREETGFVELQRGDGGGQRVECREDVVEGVEDRRLVLL